MAKTSPARFVKEVKQEGNKVTWPSRRDTVASTGVVMVMVLVAAVFFLLVDWIIGGSVRALLGI